MAGEPASTRSYDGAEAAASFGDVAAEWSALDGGAAVVDAAWRRYFTAVGEERLEFLHGQTTANLAQLAAGQGAPAAVLTAQGRPLALLAFHEDGERTWIATTAAHADSARAALSRFLVADDCDFEDDVAAGCLLVAGPGAAAALAAAGAGEASSLAAWGTIRAVIASQPVRVFARGDLRVPSFEILVVGADGEAGDTEAVRAALVAAGAARAGVDALEILRVESGAVRYGVDVDEARLAIEARLEWAIHFAKGCYVGQEVVERAVSRGRVNHEFVLLRTAAPAVVGARVEGGGDGDVVTSALRSPRLGEIALAYVPKAKAEAGSAVALVAEGGGRIEAEVLAWPRARVLPGRTA